MTLIPEEPPAEGWAAVYWLYDSADRLLYIGSSQDPKFRWNEHRKKQPWWPQVASFKMEWHRSRSHAYSAEMKAIAAAEPPHNLMGTSRYSLSADKRAEARARGRVWGNQYRLRSHVAAELREAGIPWRTAWAIADLEALAYVEASGLLPAYVAKEKRKLGAE